MNRARHSLRLRKAYTAYHQIIRQAAAELDFVYILVTLALMPQWVMAQVNVVTVDSAIGDVVIAQNPVRVVASGIRQAGDVDGDSDPDLIGLTRWWENVDGSCTVWTAHTFDRKTAFVDVQASGDFDLDGDLDMVTGSDFFDEGMSLWVNVNEGVGSGTNWVAPFLVAPFENPSALELADVDGDLDIDILAASSESGRVVWWENLSGNGTNWKERVLSSDVSGVVNVFAADVDGTPGVEVVAASGSAVQWWPDAHTEIAQFTAPSQTRQLPNINNVYAYVKSPTINSSTGRWTVTGWDRQGSDSSSGAGSSTDVFALTNHTDIAFVWQEQFLWL